MSAGGYLDACGFNPTSGGTGDFVVSTAITGYQTPASASAVNGRVYSYRAQSSDLSQWEEGFGAYTTGTTTLARTTVTASSTGSKVSFTSPPNVYITALSADLQNASFLINGVLDYRRLNLPGQLFGLTLSAAGSSSTFGIAPGFATDSSAVALMTLASAYNKTTSAWSVGSGNGALDTGSIATNTWYHVWLIQRSDTGVVDVLVSTSATAPTMPANYDRKRRIGSMKTDGSSQWTSFTQVGDKFYWASVAFDYQGAARSDALLAVSVPPGLTVFPIIEGKTIAGSGSADALLLVGHGTSSSANMLIASGGDNYGRSGSTSAYAFTNTANQIRMAATGNILAGNNTYIGTIGWIDARGRDN